MIGRQLSDPAGTVTARDGPAIRRGSPPVPGSTKRPQVSAPSVAALLRLQRLAGNSAVAGLMAATPGPQAATPERRSGTAAQSADAAITIQRDCGCGGGCGTASEEGDEAQVIQRMACNDCPLAVQRGTLDDLSAGATAVSRALAIVTQLTVNPVAALQSLGELAWDQLPDTVKGQVVNAALRAIRVMIASSPTALLPPGPPMLFAGAIKAAGLGAIDRILAMDDEFKVRLVDRLVKLFTHPTPEFALGFLLGFAQGVWDGVSGPFILLYDLGKLGLSIQQAQLEFVRRMADSDQRRQLVTEAQAIAAKAQAFAEPLLQDIMNGKADPMALLRVLDRLVSKLMEAAGGIGESIADAFVKYLQQPDRQLGEGVGWLTGTVAFEAALAYLTAGGYTVVKEALSGVRWIASAGARLGSAAAEAATALRPLLTALANFRTALAASPKGAAVLEIIEDLYRLFLRYFELSYGLKGGAERRAEEGVRGAAAGERALATGERAAVRSERTMINALGEEHGLSILLDGRIIRCSDRCLRIAESMTERAARITGARKAVAERLVRDADALAKDSAKLAASGLPEAERAAKEAELLSRAERLERQMSGLERYAANESATAVTAAEEEMRKFDARGGRTSLPPADQAFLNADPRNPMLAFDPGGNAGYRIDEARAALEAEARGTLSAPVRRGYESGADFIDGAGRPWSFKGTRPGAGAAIGQVVPLVVDEARAGRSVVADLRHLTPTDQTKAAAEIAKGLTPPHAEVRFVPPVVPPIPGRS